MKANITIDSENEACTAENLPHMLKRILARVEDGKLSGKIMDLNGNAVGKYSIEPESENDDV